MVSKIKKAGKIAHLKKLLFQLWCGVELVNQRHNQQEDYPDRYRNPGVRIEEHEEQDNRQGDQAEVVVCRVEWHLERVVDQLVRIVLPEVQLGQQDNEPWNHPRQDTRTVDDYEDVLGTGTEHRQQHIDGKAQEDPEGNRQNGHVGDDPLGKLAEDLWHFPVNGELEKHPTGTVNPGVCSGQGGRQDHEVNDPGCSSDPHLGEGLDEW